MDKSEQDEGRMGQNRVRDGLKDQEKVRER